ncbi:MAG: serine/threonine protein kinase [Calditrichaceae bacterium]
MSKKDQNLVFEKFRILKTIKQDTNRGVYIAEHIFLNKTIFLKTINKNNISDPVILERFIREAQILAQLDHPNIIKVWDFGNYDNFFYISFEHFESQNLREILRQNKLNHQDKYELVIRMSAGLQYAHDHQIIHRDLKPENILLDNQLNLKIADFGLACIENQVGSTEDTTIVGTPAYMSPEQIRGAELTGRSDLFSLGIIIYEIYGGKNPFLGADTGATLNNILNLSAAPIAYEKQNIPEDITDLISRLLQKNIKNRPERLDLPGMREITPVNIIQKPAFEKKSPHKYIWSYLAAAAVVLILSTIVISMQFNSGPVNKRLIQNEALTDKQPPEAIDSIQNVPINEKHKQETTDSKKPVKSTSIEPNQQNSAFQEDIKNISEKNITKTSFILVECQPWADVYINDIRRESTPINKPIQVGAGINKIKLIHPEYPEYTKTLNLEADKTYRISVNLDTTIGYFTCRVHPWAEIFIDGNSIGQTPLSNPVRLIPGQHELKIKNPGYSELSKRFTINKSDTVKLYFNLNKSRINGTADSR